MALVGSALVFMTGQARAQAASIPPCMDSRNTVEKNVCLRHEVEIVDHDLDVEVRRITARLRAADAAEPMFQLAKSFAIAQEQWTRFRDAECTYRSLSVGYGTSAPAAGAHCMVAFAKERLQYLKTIE